MPDVVSAWPTARRDGRAAESHLLDALGSEPDQILPPRKGILRLRRGHTAMIIGESGFTQVSRFGSSVP